MYEDKIFTVMLSVFMLFKKLVLFCRPELKAAPWSPSNILQHISIDFSMCLRFDRQKEHCPGFVSQGQLLLSVRGVVGGNETLLALSKVCFTEPSINTYSSTTLS